MTRQCFCVYLLKCSDGSYYVGMTENLEQRLAQHRVGLIEKSYTHSRRPVELVWSAQFPTHDQAFRRERQIKGWSRAKKEALIRGDWDGIHEIVKQERKKRRAKSKKTEAS
ncbi:MAG: GIY-YIG nuclease family protein [Bacteroidota bacterium]